MPVPNIGCISIQKPIIPPSSSFFLHTPAPFPTTLLIHFQLDIHYLTMRDTLSASPHSFSLTSEQALPPFAPSVLLTRPLIALISTTLPLSIPLPLHPFAHAYYRPIPLPYAKPESRPFLLQQQTTISSSESIRHPTIPHPSHRHDSRSSPIKMHNKASYTKSMQGSLIDPCMELIAL